MKKDVLKNFANFTGKPLCWSLQACNLTKKTSTQVFASEIREFFRNIYFEEYLRKTASRLKQNLKKTADFFEYAKAILLQTIFFLL